jgi:hypothetical protein
MRTIGKSFVRLSLLTALAIPSYAFAQVAEDSDADEQEMPSASEPQPDENLPPSRSDDDPIPPPASVTPVHGAVVRQAGVGGPVAYGRAGVLELGGSASFSTASDYTELSIAPSIGWFVANNFELTGILRFNYLNVETEEGGGSATSWAILAEPSYHIPFSSTLFGFVGVGAGVAHQNDEFGFAVAPRLGINFLVGRSGVLTPAIFANYSTTEAVTTNTGQTLVGVTASFGMQVGYTVMW